MDCSMSAFPVSELALTQIHWGSDVMQPSHSLSLPSPHTLNPSQHELALRVRWPKYWSSSFSISPSNEYSGLISFRTDWVDFLAVWVSVVYTHHSPNSSPPFPSWHPCIWSVIIFWSCQSKWKWKSFSCDWLFVTTWTVVHGILQATILERVAFPFCRGSSQPRNWSGVSCTAGRFFTNWAIREALKLSTADII